ncbi:MAG TPA: preprotein translocase subunit SecG [Desulfobulbaceae bacterium]|nr:preprotein translocase subunit SecG [Desulfobulbaceae bacterium]
MLTLLTVVHVIVCLFLIIVVLLQHGKGADIGATFGGSSQTLFGSEGPLPLLNKITTAAAIIFMCTSMGLAYYATHAGTDSVMQGLGQPARTETAPSAEQKPQTPEALPAAQAPMSETPAPLAVPAEQKKTETAPAVEPVKAKQDASEPASEKKK